MNVTFLIGNGFDLNLGLNTTYSEFVKRYKKIKEDDSANIRSFKENIDKNEKKWSMAELEFGKYTSKFQNTQIENFVYCMEDFCIELSKYLKEQEELISFSSNEQEEKMKKVFENISHLYDVFPLEERNLIKKTYEANCNGGRQYNFLCFNYTRTLDKFLNCEKVFPQRKVGSHNHHGNTYSHFIGEILHVHGTVDKNMVLGVNDESQIANLDLFEDEFYKRFIIKRKQNKEYRESMDEIASDLISQSHLIYIYGMSLGETDNVWWERIVNWLKQSSYNHVIIHCFDSPDSNSVYNMRYQIYERDFRRKFLTHGEGEKQLENRIHVTKQNIFEGIANIVDKS